jgi:hypothetical protein
MALAVTLVAPIDAACRAILLIPLRQRQHGTNRIKAAKSGSYSIADPHSSTNRARARDHPRGCASAIPTWISGRSTGDHWYSESCPGTIAGSCGTRGNDHLSQRAWKPERRTEIGNLLWSIPTKQRLGNNTTGTRRNVAGRQLGVRVRSKSFRSARTWSDSTGHANASIHAPDHGETVDNRIYPSGEMDHSQWRTNA